MGKSHYNHLIRLFYLGLLHAMVYQFIWPDTFSITYSGVAMAFPGGRLARPEDQNEEEKEERLTKNKRKYRKMRKDWGNVLILRTREWEAGYGPDHLPENHWPPPTCKYPQVVPQVRSLDFQRFSLMLFIVLEGGTWKYPSWCASLCYIHCAISHAAASGLHMNTP